MAFVTTPLGIALLVLAHLRGKSGRPPATSLSVDV
jgi:hypothetical protein